MGLWDVNPLNLFRITWKNERKEFGGLYGGSNYIVLPSELTGVKAKIICMVGKWFPTGCHKVGASFGCLAPRLITGQFDASYHKAVWPDVYKRQSLNHALENVLNNNRRCEVHKEVAISQVFQDNPSKASLFYNGRFDFVIYEKEYGGGKFPILAIELDGKEHMTDEAVKKRDCQKAEICRRHGFELIRVENSYARRYYYIKKILEKYFRNVR